MPINPSEPPKEEPETFWWLDWSALPKRLIWARLRVFPDGHAVVRDIDGYDKEFDSREEAVLWLLEDEYSQLADLIEDGELDSSTEPPPWP